MVTAESDSIFTVQSKNGLKNHRMETPKMIEYGLAREPYSVYPEGIFVETFRDSTEEVESSLLADHVISYKTRKLWEAIGNVVATGADDRTLYTEQLFWDEKTGRIYSNVDCKIVQKDGVHIGEGLESDQALKHWEFRNPISKLEVDAPAGGQSNSSSDQAESGNETNDGQQTSERTNPAEQTTSEHIKPDSSTSRRTIQPVEGEEATFGAPAIPAIKNDSLRAGRTRLGTPAAMSNRVRDVN
jgi:hypothetical protein